MREGRRGGWHGHRLDARFVGPGDTVVAREQRFTSGARRRDAGDPTRHGLEQHVRHALALGRQAQQIGREEEWPDVALRAGEVHGTGQRARLDTTGESGRVLRVLSLEGATDEQIVGGARELDVEAALAPAGQQEGDLDDHLV